MGEGEERLEIAVDKSHPAGKRYVASLRFVLDQPKALPPGWAKLHVEF